MSEQTETIKVTQVEKMLLEKMDYIIYVLQELLAEEETMDEEILTALEGDEMVVIRIKYSGYDPDLDEALERAMATEGFELTGRGYNFVDEVRDFVFERPGG